MKRIAAGVLILVLLAVGYTIIPEGMIKPETKKTVYTPTKYPRVIYSFNPDVQVLMNFISPDEAKYLIELAKKRLERSSVLEQGKPTIQEYRNSSSAMFERSEFSLIRDIEKRVCDLLGCQTAQIEPLQVVHYSQGQRYYDHHDYFDEDFQKIAQRQRVHTFLIYLNDIPEAAGGGTYFPKLNLRIQPTQGAALYFKNVDEKGVIEDTLHRGEEIVLPNIEKWAVNVWVSDVAYTPTP